jgi:hypothetical protein
VEHHTKHAGAGKSVYTVAVGNESYCHDLTYEVVSEDGGYRTLPGAHHTETNYVDPWVSERRNISDSTCPSGMGAQNTYSRGGAVTGTTGSGTGTLAWLTGSWRGTDDDGWTYDLVVQGDGTFTKVVNQSSSTCAQSGRVAVTSSSLNLHFLKNECNTDYVGKDDPTPIVGSATDSFTTDHGSYNVVWVRTAASHDWVVGSWRGVDAEGWTYDMTVGPDMRFTRSVAAPGGTPCSQTGTAAVTSAGLGLRFDTNVCNTDFVGKTDTRPIVSHSDSSFKLDMTSYVIQYTRSGLAVVTAPGTAWPAKVVEVTAGGQHSCVRGAGGEVACWGSDKNGIPTGAPSGEFADLSVEDGMACALTTSGQVKCWGRDDYGQQTVPGGTFTKVVVDWSFACGQSSDGSLTCWGSSLEDRNKPPAGAFTDFDVNYAYGCALDNRGAPVCWGSNTSGQLDAPAGSFRSISTGDYHACALDTVGVVACWGATDHDATKVPYGRYSAVSAGYYHTCAIRQDDAGITCWGDNDKGQTSAPSGRFTQLSAGDYHTCALRETGDVVCWGNNEHGESTVP